jgi:uncharacterized protein
MAKRDVLTASDFFRYFQCPHWPYWERFGNPKDRRRLTAAEEQRLADGLAHEKSIVKKQFGTMREVRVVSAPTGFQKTLALMKAGAPVIYQGWLMDGDWIGRPDILERHEGKSVFGNWYYVPIDVKRSHELKKEHLAQLAFYATLLERIQGHFPGEPAIVNGDGERLPAAIHAFQSEFMDLVQKLNRIRAGEMPDPVYRKACVDTSPWGEACFRLAEERNDIALLFNVDVKKLAALRQAGIRTVQDAAALDVDALEGSASGLTRRALEAVRRQAESLSTLSVIIREPFHDPTHGMEIHFDIESYPPEDVDYLYGFWLCDPSGDRYHAFTAERPGDERVMWKTFLAWIETLPSDYTVYHYANYEPSRLTILAKRYGDEANPWLEKFRHQLVDLKELTREHAVFPLHFYSLKAIAKFLGFTWEGDVQGGGESVLAYERWLKTKRQKILDGIIQYNQEDVRATAYVLNWLRSYAVQHGTYAEPYPWEIR